ncbi:snRNA-activating protein complex subunit 3 isoform X2 [Athalia rosae]|uniref:snRNA-activating protein complex subunit 3 isoform X2 n=1 Tax=Athalia rosae TaxID=37344 RepID=UPI0020345A72|nr:snRNA-activating protein complex subunit 3 isoform X2 [Athalia rosae]
MSVCSHLMWILLSVSYCCVKIVVDNFLFNVLTIQNHIFDAMDDIYGFYAKSSSERLNIFEYFKKYSELANLKQLAQLRSNDDQQSGILQIMEMDIGEENFAALAEYCNVQNLTIPGEFAKPEDTRLANRKDTYESKDIPPNVDLQTLKTIQRRLKMPQKSFIHNLKYRGELCISGETKLVGQEQDQTIEPGKDFLLFVRIYLPFLHQTKFLTRKPKVSTSHIVAILGTQTLAQLRDLIICTSDLSISTERSDNPHITVQHQAKDVYKSAFFYIENTFYNDLRDAANHDNSQDIRTWAEGRNLGPFKVARMEDTTINSLNVRFGFPWVYQHQGTCEHLIVFSDARLVNLSDPLSVSSYPRIHRMRACSTKYCMVCGMFAANWITTNNERIPHEPCYFCNSCFQSFNYINGTKIGNFKAYLYPSTNVTDSFQSIPLSASDPRTSEEED